MGYFTAQPRFTIKSVWNKKYLEGSDDGGAIFADLDATNLRQVWVWSNVGNQLLNVETRLPLEVGFGRAFVQDENGRLVNPMRPTTGLRATSSGLKTQNLNPRTNMRWILTTA